MSESARLVRAGKTRGGGWVKLLVEVPLGCSRGLGHTGARDLHEDTVRGTILWDPQLPAAALMLYHPVSPMGADVDGSE